MLVSLKIHLVLKPKPLDHAGPRCVILTQPRRRKEPASPADSPDCYWGVGGCVVVGATVVVVVVDVVVVVSAAVVVGAAVVVVAADSAACAGAMIDSTTGLVHRAGNSISVATPPTKIVIFLTTSLRVVS